tara:strand:+ start:171 stop:407 length:237 start_codon:yes stop_codon:yes gene_type:complete
VQPLQSFLSIINFWINYLWDFLRALAKSTKYSYWIRIGNIIIFGNLYKFTQYISIVFLEVIFDRLSTLFLENIVIDIE